MKPHNANNKNLIIINNNNNNNNNNKLKMKNIDKELKEQGERYEGTEASECSQIFSTLSFSLIPLTDGAGLTSFHIAYVVTWPPDEYFWVFGGTMAVTDCRIWLDLSREMHQVGKIMIG
ncbi:hypothetical protein E2C01_050973 [Portunus trituberculatus]|uniref:Uncharacterized protein n=1 Tax=Portunus trituberculatus TaxID=210409 RepID=A0A5B7GHW8_PORTR|nr:hypothetical protein [Portunus trituberculatus]